MGTVPFNAVTALDKNRRVVDAAHLAAEIADP
jgi:hypothetical protein